MREGRGRDCGEGLGRGRQRVLVTRYSVIGGNFTLTDETIIDYNRAKYYSGHILNKFSDRDRAQLNQDMVDYKR